MLGLQHLYQRKKNIESSRPQTVRAVIEKTKLDILIYVAAVLGPLALLPQVLSLFTTRDASGLFLPTWLMFGALNFLWILYGRAHGAAPIVIANTAFMILNFLVVVGIVLYS